MKKLPEVLIAAAVPTALNADSQAQWVHTNGPYGAEVSAIATLGTETFAATGHGIFVSVNGGATWTASSFNGGGNPGPVAAICVVGSTLFVGLNAPSQMSVSVSSDSGRTWKPSSSGLQSGVSAIAACPSATGGTDIFVGTGGGEWAFSPSGIGVFLSTDNGAIWVAANAGLPDTLINALAADSAEVFAGFNGCGIYRSTDGATSWSKVDSGLTSRYIFSLRIAGNNIFAGTDSGLFVSKNNGITWTIVDEGIPRVRVGAIAAKGTGIYAGTADGVYLSTDGGTSWTGISSGLTNRTIDTIALGAGGSGKTVLFAGTSSDMYVSGNNGTTCEVSDSGLPQGYVIALATVGPDVLAGTIDGLFVSTDSGGSWQCVHSVYGLGNVTCFASSGTDLYAGGLEGVLRSTDGGLTWSLPGSASRSLQATSLIAAPNGAGGTSLFAGSIDGGYIGIGVSRSTDDGKTWTVVDSGLTNPWIFSLASYTDGKGVTHIFAGVQNGGVFVSTNSGTSWTLPNKALKDVITNCLVPVPNPAMGFDLFAGTNGGVYVSTDDGTSWSLDANGLADPNVQCMTLVGTSLFAGTYRAGVSESPDNASTWSSVNEGLTEMDIHSLAATQTDLYLATQDGVWRRPLSQLTDIEGRRTSLPTKFQLMQNYPNPFNPTTVIRFVVPGSGFVSLKVYNVLGQLVKTLVDKVESPGSHEVTFTAAGLASGVYFYRLDAASYSKTMKLMLLK